MTELKPCPFCHRSQNLSVEAFEPIERYIDGEPDGTIPIWHVYCGYCGATGPEALLNREDAVTKWNRRDGSE